MGPGRRVGIPSSIPPSPITGRRIQDYQIALGFRHTGTFPWRPQDDVGFAVGTTHVNLAAFGPNAGGNEVPFEVWYGWQATGWMNLKFDAQYVINPGGRGFNAAGVKTDNAFVLGMRLRW